ncbi:DNA cytosine methyltransferase [Microbacterium sp. No. 7]|uniref:DNA cytosine methyltransferase n=1 Tax=Microbacterium sp. No. 7 TaxID=1714373 RepID=UPI0006CF81DF|nr:DNA cytosine methyltransferase [Microbacterium sp. No. 7]ALJ22079.1 hypothetical protein AOA12_20170 [Microbacterium sp. No. 7]
MTPITLRAGSLFSGYGGLDLGVVAALARFGFRVEPAWFCEFDEAPSRILAHHWPDVPNLGDVTKVDFTKAPRVDVMSGGFPCQDVSVAGRQQGLKDGTRSGLWAEFRRAISEQRPRLVVIENVRGLLSADGEPWHDEMTAADAEVRRWDRVAALIEHRIRRWAGDRDYVRRKRAELVRVARHRKRALARREREHRLVQRAIATVLRDLADLGFDAEWTGLEASTVGAPHARFRVFIIAWPREGGAVAPDPERCGE